MGAFLTLGAFALFFLSDYNDWRPAYRSLKLCFPAGGVLLLIGTVWECRRFAAPLSGGMRVAAFAGAAAFGVLLLYTLFFALPVGASYAKPGEKRRACTTGVYALCRHPGVLWFAGVYGCLHGACGLPLWEAVALSGLNVLLVVFEDRCVFPEKLEGYDVYQAATPFLVPSRKSIQECLRAN